MRTALATLAGIYLLGGLALLAYDVYPVAREVAEGGPLRPVYLLVPFRGLLVLTLGYGLGRRQNWARDVVVVLSLLYLIFWAMGVVVGLLVAAVRLMQVREAPVVHSPTTPAEWAAVAGGLLVLPVFAAWQCLLLMRPEARRLFEDRA
jgi:hypothetical protein